MIQAFHQALQIKTSFDMCFWVQLEPFRKYLLTQRWKQCRSTHLWQSWSEASAHTGAEEGKGFGGWVARRGRRILLRPSAGARGVLAHTVSAGKTRYMTGHDIKM